MMNPHAPPPAALARSTKPGSAPPWWINPAYKDPLAAKFDGLAEFPPGSYELLESALNRLSAASGSVRVDEGEFVDLAALLFMINGHRPGPIAGFYVVVETIKGAGWCVAQLHADAATPIRIFSSPVYPSEAEARQAGERLRLADVGNAPPRI